MEHRCTTRHPITIDILLCNHQQSTAVYCKTSNAGAGGIFIDKAPELYKTNALLAIEFEVELSRRHNIFRRYRRPVMVVHTSNEGVGLTFLDTDIETMHAWQKTIDRASGPHSVTTRA